MQDSHKTRRIVAWVLVVPATMFLLLAGSTKMLGANPLASIEAMAPWVFWIGLGEVTAALLYALPRTSIIGALFLSAHLGGAILFHIIRGENFFGPVLTSFWFQSLMLASVWLVVVLRYPAIVNNFQSDSMS
ncbi:DoxX family protein [Pseudohongiella sp. O18]|uniref:DoxX family protein n=1 Tax=Pseudohongiella sp. O18 TaxID=2904248 RepID=UPI001F387CD3|nr:DoxX family protein [Pseudohongiella sp. O18]